MYKKLLLAASIIAVAALQAKADTIEPYRSLCMINTEGGQGTGTLIAIDKDGKGLILTCRHVARAVGNKVMCRFIWAGGGTVINGEVSAVVKGTGFDTDLALIVIDTVPPGITVRPVAHFDAAKGPWIGAGFRDGWLRVTHPIHTAVQYSNGLIIFPSPLIQGMSGGALFDKHGNVVAVLVASDLTTTGIASDGENLHRMIREFLAQKSVLVK